MHRGEIICRGLTGVCTVGGVVTLALYILGTFGSVRPVVTLVVHTRWELQEASLQAGREDTLTHRLLGEWLRDWAWAARDRDQIDAWQRWYYSPANLHYWAMAMLFFFPALSCHLLARGLAWYHQHQAERPPP
jgi:hypothetical protein